MIKTFTRIRNYPLKVIIQGKLAKKLGVRDFDIDPWYEHRTREVKSEETKLKNECSVKELSSLRNIYPQMGEKYRSRKSKVQR